MKQKQESKITTLCRLVAVYNRTFLTFEYPVRVDVKIIYGVRVRLVLVTGNNTDTMYSGNVDGAIAYIARCLCGTEHSEVRVTVEF